MTTINSDAPCRYVVTVDGSGDVCRHHLEDAIAWFEHTKRQHADGRTDVCLVDNEQGTKVCWRSAQPGWNWGTQQS